MSDARCEVCGLGYTDDGRGCPNNNCPEHGVPQAAPEPAKSRRKKDAGE